MIQGRATCYKQIDLELRGMVDEIGACAVADGPPERLTVHVEVRRKSRHDSWNVRFLESGDEINVDRGARLTREGAGQRSADCVGNAERLEHVRDRKSNCNRIDRSGHFKSSRAISG
jgi:hypothetical protein